MREREREREVPKYTETYHLCSRCAVTKRSLRERERGRGEGRERVRDRQTDTESERERCQNTQKHTTSAAAAR